MFHLSSFSCSNNQIFLNEIANAHDTRRNTIFRKLVGEKWPYLGCPCHICIEVRMYGFTPKLAGEQSRFPTREGSGVRIVGRIQAGRADQRHSVPSGSCKSEALAGA